MPQNGEPINLPKTFMSEVQIIKKPMPDEPPHWAETLRTMKVKECFEVPLDKRGSVQSIAFRMGKLEGKEFTIRTVVNEDTGKPELFCWRVK